MNPKVKAVESNPVEGDAGSPHQASRRRRGRPGGLSRPLERHARLLARHDPRPTLHGMRVTPALERWRDTPRKWLSLTTWSGQDFVVEDK